MIELTQWLKDELEGRSLLFLTLTTPYEVRKEDFSSAIRIYLRKIKRRTLGRGCEEYPLCSVVIFEKNFHQGIHSHIILENPYSVGIDKTFKSKLPISRLLKDEWVNMRIGGKLVGQDCQQVFDVFGVIGYMTKTNFCPEFLDQVDINNLYLPSINPSSNNHFPGGITNKVTRMIGVSNQESMS
jgi:hypothetical protein